MAQVEPVSPVKLFVVTLHQEASILENAVEELQEHFGKTDWISEDFPFDVTGYYENEMGKNLLRRFYSFEQLISPEKIVEAKLLTNEIEENYRGEKGRRINLDPGYLDTYKVVLASAKFGGQKIYLRDGIYADMTLVMYKGQWEPFAWGFPDFKSRRYDSTLSKIRDLYKAQMKSRS
ncbi:MAG TPA: DUF4416 family protein [Acidobacteriota bacterium]|nr:DUF4416 family protein [Acidobacteriota bacterium]